MRILFVGDVVGKAGREAIRTHLPGCINQWKVELVIVNGENAADQGFGITQPIYDELLAAGADAVTLGNHSWNRREALQFIKDAPRLIRPINYLSGTPGRGAALVKSKTGRSALVINALGRLFMEPVEDPFGRIGAELDASPLGRTTCAIVVDFPLRGHRRKARGWALLRRTSQPRRRHAYPYAQRRRQDPARRHRLHDGRRHDRRLQLYRRYGKGRAAAALYNRRHYRPLRTVVGRSDNVWRRGGNRR